MKVVITFLFNAPAIIIIVDAAKFPSNYEPTSNQF